VIACLCLHSLPKTSSWHQEEIHHTQKVSIDRNTDHEHHLKEIRQGRILPQILIGASNSNKIGWFIKISLDFKHNPLTSYSVKLTCFPGRHLIMKHLWIDIITL